MFPDPHLHVYTTEQEKKLQLQLQRVKTSALKVETFILRTTGTYVYNVIFHLIQLTMLYPVRFVNRINLQAL